MIKSEDDSIAFNVITFNISNTYKICKTEIKLIIGKDFPIRNFTIFHIIKYIAFSLRTITF